MDLFGGNELGVIGDRADLAGQGSRPLSVDADSPEAAAHQGIHAAIRGGALLVDRIRWTSY